MQSDLVLIVTSLILLADAQVGALPSNLPSVLSLDMNSRTGAASLR